MAIIFKRDYNLIRKKLCSQNPKIVKTGIQDMLHLLENGHRFSGSAKIEKADFEAFVIELLKNADYDIRKWFYHLLCFVPLNESKRIISNYCIRNISLELSINNIENISWIVAVCGATYDDVFSFESCLYEKDINAYLTDDQIRLASSAFRINPFYEFNYEHISSVVDEINPISPIWLTKMYANQFVPVMNRQKYMQRRTNISIDTFAALLSHSDEEVRKYAMWAFAQEPNGNMSSILPYVPLDQVFSLESGKQKWLFVKMFQDKEFLCRNEDFVQEIGRNLRNFPTNVREGILLGCKKVGYTSALDDFIIDWETEGQEDSENNLLSLYEYIFTNASKNADFCEIAKFTQENINSIPYFAVKDFVKHYSLERSNPMSNPVFNGQQINYFANEVYHPQINSFGIENEKNALDNQKEAIEHIRAEIELLKDRIDKSKEYTDDTINSMIAHLEYGLKELQDSASVSSDYMNELSDAIQGIRQETPKKRGEKIQNILPIIANTFSIAANSPQLINIAQEFIDFIKAAL